jgi:hypothetical protein
MSRSTTRAIAAFIGGVVLAVVVALAASAAFRPAASPSPEPSTPPIVTPTTPPSEAPSEEPTPKPTEAPADGPTVVALETLTGDDVSVEIDDQTGRVVSAESGTPGDGMSVRWFDVKVENIDADTLHIVWVGLPRDEVVRLGVSTVEGKMRLRFVQEAPPANSDALGFDRILEVSFAEPVRSEDVLTSVQESLDTQD